ncbi:RimK family alpha-L-glutamate ligase [Paenibacillus antarcticus]|uniref:Lysine biosynthesis protein LysX n=1 Tax=Paenibacillus antarcticus TaxID=253703 RepID=A0A168LAM5_9BACL|nr:RimK family alpha-L-glutamate ligase [Paenibacillus antarcticus]OAB43101.1 lysine biosynthesis protein LysX [Paenibacillus antarcticus]
MSNHTDVLICVTKLREEEKRISDFLKEDGFNVEINLDSMDLPLETEQSEQVGLALIRCLSQKQALSRSTLLELAGLETLNSVKAITICTNKIHQSIVFHKANIPQPRFKVAFTASHITESFDDFHDGFVIKPASSSWGRGIARIVGKDSLDTWIAARESLDPTQQSFPVLVQEFIDKGDFDIRVVIVGSKPIVAFRRVSIDNWKTNTHLGAEIETMDINPEIRFICKQLIDVLGEGIYGLDLFYDFKNNCYLVCEINQNPEFAKSWKVHGVDVADHIAQYLKHKIAYKSKFAQIINS